MLSQYSYFTDITFNCVAVVVMDKRNPAASDFLFKVFAILRVSRKLRRPEAQGGNGYDKQSGHRGVLGFYPPV
ncbi:MAG: hypothetical protein M2R45_04863 [Verrucomicrobia subdivision 3 bacterium]|nr:hypothetical protein [Limisphaerales bacterium]MCS1417530.1 hypothetical protein [Limisphaerales bacterium]